MKLIFLGAPGVGKGTQADLLSKKLNIPHISTGDLFRNNIKNKTPLGTLAKEYIDKGILVPDNVTNNMVKEALIQSKKGYILDGYPRTISQAEFLSSVENIDKVINFVLSEPDIIKRISGRRTCKNCQSTYHIIWNPPKKEGICDRCNGELTQRTDELPETVKKRLDVYNKETCPLAEYYKKKGLLIEIDASPNIEEIEEEVLIQVKKVKITL